jgi:hypothetical protein
MQNARLALTDTPVTTKGREFTRPTKFSLPLQITETKLFHKLVY